MHVVIIGNGIAGITAARHVRKRSNAAITVISGETEFAFSRTALMYIYMGHMPFERTKLYEDWFWDKNNINLKQAWITKVDFEAKKLFTADDRHVQYDELILATGSAPNKFGWPGQDLEGVQGLYSYQDLQALEQNTKDCKRAVIVGGGLIGIEMAEMLRSRGIEVTFLVREKSFWNMVLPEGESSMINRHINEHHIDLQLETELKEIIGDEHGKAKAVVTSKGETIECQVVGLTAGVHPNINFVKNTALELDRGILINRDFTTNIPNVYAIGDCAQFRNPLLNRRPLEQVWYTGKMHGEVVARNICGERLEYNPGPWFNSAKFLDIEYQTYGTVLAQQQEGEERLYWEDTENNRCIHMVYEKASGQFIGINLFGVRARHEVFDQWLRDEVTIEHVLTHLKSINFDPEFYKGFEKSVVEQYNKQGGNIQLKKSLTQLIFG